MNELIYKHEAYIILKDEAASHMLPASHEAYERASRLIDLIPSVEAFPVHYAHWELNIQKNGYLWKCSNCKGNFDQMFSICPHCFSFMR